MGLGKTRETVIIFHSKIFLLFETISLIVLPIVIFWFKPELLRYRIQILIGGFIYILYLFIIARLTFYQIGLTTSNFKAGLKSILPLTIIVFAVLMASIPYKYDSRFLFIEVLTQEALGKYSLSSFILNLFISSSLQEIIFRGFYITRLELVTKNKFFLVFMTSLIFSLVHTPFKNNFFTAGTFILGVAYSLNFLKYRNIYSIIISHAIILSGLTLTILY